MVRHQRSLDAFGVHIFGFGIVRFTEGTNTLRVIALGYMVGIKAAGNVETNSQMTMTK